VEFIECRNYRRVADAIRRLEVRGAPAIGAAAAFGLVLGAKELLTQGQELFAGLRSVAEELRATRPTAVNLFWAIDRMLSVVSRFGAGTSGAKIVAALEDEAIAIAHEDEAVNRKIGHYGATLLGNAHQAVLTHCNAGALATVAFGTALGIIRHAWELGKITRVFADETRPLLQGARLTAWELQQDGIPVTLITDSMAGWVMKNKLVQAVIVGADRIAANGDVANKIGTYSVAVLAKENDIPFYVAAPTSTFDFSIASGDEIPIEERDPDEVRKFCSMQSAPSQVSVFNPAFDVTPNKYITAIITEYGIVRSPYSEMIAKLKSQRG
jgi:methylthioribose-1-phosphate isomerase